MPDLAVEILAAPGIRQPAKRVIPQQTGCKECKARVRGSRFPGYPVLCARRGRATATDSVVTARERGPVRARVPRNTK